MADDKKSGGDGMGLGALLLWGLLVLFVMWIISGGPERMENKTNPLLNPPETYDGDFSVYGEGGKIQTGVEKIITEGIYKGWNLEDRINFSFLTPPNWSTRVKGNFSGTEFGEIKSQTVTLEYQYGRDINKLEFEKDPNYLVEYGRVNKRWTRFVKPKNDFGEITGAYIKKNKRKQITIYTNQKLTPEQEKEVFEIINTIKI